MASVTIWLLGQTPGYRDLGCHRADCSDHQGRRLLDSRHVRGSLATCTYVYRCAIQIDSRETCGQQAHDVGVLAPAAEDDDGDGDIQHACTRPPGADQHVRTTARMRAALHAMLMSR